jgi:glycosyltransferase involved in cell wall biosynthesis
MCTINRCKKDSLLASAMASLEAYAHRTLNVRQNVDAFVAPSLFLRTRLLERGFGADRVWHLPLFISEALLAPWNPSGGYLLFLGRIEQIKGIETLLAAARESPLVQVVIAGSGSKDDIEKLCRSLPPNVRYVGFVGGKELEELVLGCLALVMPSIWYENQPLSMLEAMARAKPVIASNIGGMRELLRDCETGLLVQPGNTSALAHAMQWACAHRTEMEVMGLAARQYILANHTTERHLKRLLEIYAHVGVAC